MLSILKGSLKILKVDLWIRSNFKLIFCVSRQSLDIKAVFSGIKGENDALIIKS